jgi:sugar O-acyltransferase (sialic acid O-acetyltransferase NeuD family)
MKEVVIVGAGNQARVARVLLSKDTEYEVAAFTVHEAYVPDEPLLGLDVVPFESIQERYPPDQFALCIAMGFARVNKVRAAFYQESIEKGYEVISYVSSKAVHWGEFEIGKGSFVFENAVVHPWVRIGNNVSIGPGCILGHDVVVGDHCFIAPGTVIPGCVEIEPYCFIGANATLRDGVKIARECVIGAGANILEDTVERGVYNVKSTPAADTTSDLLSPFFGMPRR